MRKVMPAISIVIPHKGRDSILAWHLRELQNQSFDDFDVIVVLDMSRDDDDGAVAEQILVDNPGRRIAVKYSGGVGPGPSRNIGAQHAKSDVVLVLGSDCIPDRDLVARHYEQHAAGADIAQGYTPFHPDVVTPFYDFLDSSGLQAAWSNLQKDGVWATDISPAFCLTTNWSIKRQLLLNEPFAPELNGAAWDDIELGYRLSKYGDAISARMAPRAINYHYHRYDFDSFLQRCRMEGYHRIGICKLHPEMAWNMLNPFDIRAVKDINPDEIVKWAKELDSVNVFRDDEQARILKEIKYNRYAEACKVFSHLGVLDRIKDEHPAIQAIQHVHQPAQLIQILTGVAALESGNTGYASHTAEWFMTERDDDWSAYAFAGEVEVACGNIEEAIANFRKSLSINSGEKWAKKSLSKLM